jgi:hypothetical protein
MRARTKAHGNNIRLRHFIEYTLGRPLAILLASSTIRNKNLLNKLAESSMELPVVLKK